MKIKFITSILVAGIVVKCSEPATTPTDGDIGVTLLPQQDPNTTTASEPTPAPEEAAAESFEEELIDEQLRPPFIPGDRCVFCPGFLPPCPCRFPFECQLIPRTCFTCPRWTCARRACVICPPGLPPCRCGPFSRCVYSPGTCSRCPGWRCVPFNPGPFPPGPFPPGPIPPVPVPFAA